MTSGLIFHIPQNKGKAQVIGLQYFRIEKKIDELSVVWNLRGPKENRDLCARSHTTKYRYPIA